MENKNQEKRLQQRIEYYQTRVENAFKRFPTDFREFIKGKEIIQKGDSLIENYQSTGYNFANIQDFPFLGNEPIIFYSNYIQRTSHFAELLATMESEGVIEEDDVSFGARATKVNGKWGDEEPVEGSLIGVDGKTIVTTEFVEGIVIFSPKGSSPKETIRKIRNIAKFIESRAVKGAASEIKNSWYVPDDRIKPLSLLTFLRQLNFKEAVANYFACGKGNLIALKQKSKFKEKGWDNCPIILNEKLYGYLSDFPEGKVLP